MKQATGSWAQATSIAALQLGCAALAVGLSASFGALSVFPPMLATLGASCAFAPLTGRPWDRPAIQRLARRVAVVHGLTAAVLVLGAAAARPHWFDGAQPFASALAASLFAAATGSGLALCGLNATAQSWGSLNGREPTR